MAKGLPNGSIDWADRAAVIASLACMVHCLALPLIVAALPALSAVLTVPEAVHVWVLAFAAPTAAFALFQGLARHGAWLPLLFGATGVALLAVGVLVLGRTATETPVTVAGSLSLVFAHVANWRLRRTCAG